MSSEQNHLRLDPPAVRSMLSVFDGLATDLARETEHLAQAGAAAAAGDPHGYLRNGLDHLESAVAKARMVEAQLRDVIRNSELTVQAFEQHDALVAAANTALSGSFGTLHTDAINTGNPGKQSIGYRIEDLEYQAFPGQLFVQPPEDAKDIEINDITQGSLNNCYLMAGLAAIAWTNPERIRNAIQDNGDGTYTVTFYERTSGIESWFRDYDTTTVTVDHSFPTLKGTQTPIYARFSDSQELWPLIIEKAYAQYKGNNYESIEFGNVGAFINVMTGRDNTFISIQDVDFVELKKQFDDGKAITAGTLDEVIDAPAGVSKDHSYVIQAIDVEN